MAHQVLLPWVANPMRVEYIDDADKTLHGGKRFAYGTTSLHGHLLAGEERFALDWNPVTNNVTYRVISFSLLWLSRAAFVGMRFTAILVQIIF